MKYQDFEKGLRNKLLHTEAAVDVSDLIQKVHGSKSRKRRTFLWIFLSLSTLALGYSGMHYASENKVQQGASIHIDEEHIEAPKEHLAIAEKETPIIQEEEKEEHITVNFQGKIIKEGNEERKLEEEQKEVHKEHLAIAEEETPIIQDKDDHITVNSQSKINKEAREEMRLEEEQLFVEGEESKSTQKLELDPSRQKHSDDVTSEAVADVVAKEAISEKTDTDINELSDESEGQNSLFEEGRKTLLYNFLSSEIGVLESERLLPKPVVCPSFRKPRWAFDLIPEVGLIVPLKNLSINNEEASDIFNMRSEDENSLEGITMAIHARARPLKKQFYFKLGIAYTRISERMNLTTKWVVQDTTVGIISITQSQSGDTITTIYGDIITETEYFNTSRDHYFLHLVDVPIAIGYHRPIGKGWKLGLEGGIHLNVAFLSRGKLLEGSGEDSFTQLPAEGRFRKRIGFSHYVGLTLEKKISTRSSIFVSPRIRYFAGSFTPASYDIRQSYALAGLHVGYIHTIR